MTIKTIILSICLLSTMLVEAQNFTINGYVRDSSNGEAMLGASVWIGETQTGDNANEYGFYAITLPKGTYTLNAEYAGYRTFSKIVKLDKNVSINIELASSGIKIKQFVVKSKRKDKNIKSVDVGVNTLKMKSIKKMPAFMGEVDLIKSIQLLPGVSTVGEGASGFNVRGGNTDQNLIMQDEAPVYNSSHLFGFFSVFNPDAIKDAKLTKGGIPSKYGGRLSSVLDVRMKDGNKKKFELNGGIGTVFSRLSVEGPIIKNKASFIVAGRRSYIDVLAKPFVKSSSPLKNSEFYFYDLTAKVNYDLNKNNKFFISSYMGRDVFAFKSGDASNRFDWGNTTLSARWNHIFSNKLFSNFTYFYSNYDYKLKFAIGDNGFDWASNIINQSLKADFAYKVNKKNKLRFGGQAIYYTFKPANASAGEKGKKVNFSFHHKFALENAVYIDDEIKYNKNLSIRAGLRFSHFTTLGSGHQFNYKEPTFGQRKELTSIDTFGDNKGMTNYFNLEPRLSMRYSLNKESSLKMGYNRMAQYIHLLSNTAASIPLDIWTPSTNNIKPQIADQISLGYFRNFKKNVFETSVEVYYKHYGYQVDYIDGAQLLLNEFFEADLKNGIGRAYGAEFFIKKSKGKLNGWISYTLARSERKVTGINNDKYYPVRFDKPHNLTVVAIYDFNKKWTASANFVYYTGTPTTFPTDQYNAFGYNIPHNAEDSRNNYRIPAYHRMDLSVTWNVIKTKRVESNWVFSVYNAYNRKNAFSVYFGQDELTGNNQATRFSVVGSILPAVSYNFKF